MKWIPVLMLCATLPLSCASPAALTAEPPQDVTFYPSSRPSTSYVAPSVPEDVVEEPIVDFSSVLPAAAPPAPTTTINDHIEAKLSPQYQSVMNSSLYVSYGLAMILVISAVMTYKKYCSGGAAGDARGAPRAASPTGKYARVLGSDPDNNVR